MATPMKSAAPRSLQSRYCSSRFGIEQLCAGSLRLVKPMVCRAQAAAQGTEAVTLSPELRRTTAILDVPNAAAPGGTTKVYLLAMSHVSAVSCDQVRELISAVSPDVVMVELCKDRLGLLATDLPPGPRVWHTPNLRVSGVPESSGFPTPEELLQLLVCKPGRPVSTEDIEADVVRLQETGLFRSVRPTALSGTVQDAPMFLVNSEDGELRLDTVPPLNQIEFRCEPRSLPPLTALSCRVDSSAAAAGVLFTPEQLEAFSAAALDAANADDAKTVSILMKIAADVKSTAACPVPLDVLFEGAETGKVEAVVVARKAGAPRIVTGLESSAVDGAGFGITPFQNPNRGSDVKVGLTSRLPASAVERIARSRSITADLTSGDEAEVNSTGRLSEPLPQAIRDALKRGTGRSQWRKWTWKELATAADEDPAPQPLKDALADTLTGWYGKLQGKAGETVGIDGGAAWRAAMEEAVKCGASQVILGDRPAFVTQRRLAQGVWDALAPRFLIGVAGVNLSVVAGSLGLVPSAQAYEALGASVALTLALMAPVALPFFEIWRFSRMSAEEIEAAVRVPEPIEADLDAPMKLFGEDALLDWPGAAQSIISERDAYMARAAAAAALGREGQVPAFVMDKVDGYPVLRYMMADGAPNKAAPTGKGDGAYQPLADASAVVAIIGSAHVRGMSKTWQEAQRNVSVSELLQS